MHVSPTLRELRLLNQQKPPGVWGTERGAGIGWRKELEGGELGDENRVQGEGKIQRRVTDVLSSLGGMGHKLHQSLRKKGKETPQSNKHIIILFLFLRETCTMRLPRFKNYE